MRLSPQSPVQKKAARLLSPKEQSSRGASPASFKLLFFFFFFFLLSFPSFFKSTFYSFPLPQNTHTLFFFFPLPTNLTLIYLFFFPHSFSLDNLSLYPLLLLLLFFGERLITFRLSPNSKIKIYPNSINFFFLIALNKQIKTKTTLTEKN